MSPAQAGPFLLHDSYVDSDAYYLTLYYSQGLQVYESRAFAFNPPASCGPEFYDPNSTQSQHSGRTSGRAAVRYPGLARN